IFSRDWSSDVCSSDLCHASGQYQINVRENFIHLTLANVHPLHLTQFKTVCRDDVLLLVQTHALPEQAGLGKKITKGFAAITDFVTRHCLSIRIEPAPHRRFRCFLGPASVNGIGFVTGTPLVDRLAMKGITLVVVEGTYRTVDR